MVWSERKVHWLLFHYSIMSLTFKLVISQTAAPSPEECIEAIKKCGAMPCSSDERTTCIGAALRNECKGNNKEFVVRSIEYFARVCHMKGVKDVPDCIQLFTYCPVQFTKPNECKVMRDVCKQLALSATPNCTEDLINKFFDELRATDCKKCMMEEDCVQNTGVEIKCADNMPVDEQVECTSCQPTKDTDMPILNALCQKDAVAVYNNETENCDWLKLVAGMQDVLILASNTTYDTPCKKREAADAAWNTCPETKSDVLDKFFTTKATCGAGVLTPTALIILLVAALANIF